MIDKRTFSGAVDRVVGDVKLSNEKDRVFLTRIARRIKQDFADRVFENMPSDLLNVCDEIDSRVTRYRIPERLESLADHARYKALMMLLSSHYDERVHDEVQAFDVAHQREIRRQQTIAEAAALLSAHLRPMKEDLPETFDQHWLKARCADIIQPIEHLLISHETQTESWDELRSMLPDGLKCRFTIDRQQTLPIDTVKMLNEYRDIATKLGPEAVAQLLVSTGRIPSGGFNGAMKIITPYLGRCATEEPDFSDVIHYPDVLLRYQDIRSLLFIKLRNRVYSELQAQQDDMARAGETFDQDDFFDMLMKMERNVERIVAEKLGVDRDTPLEVHRELFEEVLTYFRDEIATMKTPDRMVDVIHSKSGDFPFPSLRQLIAMNETAKHRRLLVGFDMGLGKTETVFAAKEHVGAKHMLFICIPNMETDIAARVRRDVGDPSKSCYKDGEEPDVGIVTSLGRKMNEDELSDILENEVVVIPYSMLTSSIRKRDGSDCAVSDYVIEHCQTSDVPFDFMGIDEVHRARNLDGRQTQAIYDLATKIPGLYDEGHIVSLSGDPTPNKPTDIVPQLRLHDNDVYGRAKSVEQTVRTSDPLIVRNALLKYWLVLDKPMDWERHVERIEYALHPEERAIYDAIFENEEMSTNDKLRLLQLVVLNPSLIARGREIPSALFDRMTEKTDEYLEEYGTVMIAENVAKQGVSREHGKYAGENARILCDRLREHLQAKYGDGVRFHIIDGDTPDTGRNPRRTQAIRDSIESEQRESKAPKTVIFAMSGCLREGKDLSHVHRVIVLEPEYNKPDLAQFVRRFAREGNTDVEVSLLIARDTVHEGKAAHADIKYNITQAMKNGGTFTKNDLALFDAEEIARGQRTGEALSNFVSPLLRFVTSGNEKLQKMIGYGASGKDIEKLERFFAEFGSEFAELYCDRWEKSHGGNNNRFIGGLIRKIEADGMIDARRIADLGCGPLGLEQTIGFAGNRRISSVDMCGNLMEYGIEMMQAKHGIDARPYFCKKGSMHDLKAVDEQHFADGTFDVVNCAAALYWTKLDTRVKSRKKLDVPRVRALSEANRILKTGGVYVITLPPRRCTPDQLKRFTENALPLFGFELLPQFSGQGRSTEADDHGNRFRNITITCRKIADMDPEALVEQLDVGDLKFTRPSRSSSGNVDGTPETGKLRDGFRHTTFSLNDIGFSFGEDPEKDAEQRMKLQALEDAVSLIRKLWRSRGKSFANFARNDYDRLADAGLQMLELDCSGSDMLYLFKHEDVDGQLFDPLDEGKWGSID